MGSYNKTATRITLIIFGVLLLGSAVMSSATAQSDNRPRLRILHAAAGLANVDAYVDNTLYFDNIFYRYVSDYVPIGPGDRTLKVRPAGDLSGGGSLVEVTAPYQDNQDYTIVAAGRTGSVQYWRINDDNELPGDGSSKVRIVHAAHEVPSTDVCLADVCRTLAFRENTGYFKMSPGTYAPQLRLNNTDLTVVETPPLVLQNNGVHTIFLVGKDQKNPTLQLLYSLDAGEDEGYLPAPPPGPGQPLPGGPGGTLPPPVYPPVTGAFLSPQLMLFLLAAAIGLFSAAGVGYWVIRRRPYSRPQN